MALKLNYAINVYRKTKSFEYVSLNQRERSNVWKCKMNDNISIQLQGGGKKYFKRGDLFAQQKETQLESAGIRNESTSTPLKSSDARKQLNFGFV